MPYRTRFDRLVVSPPIGGETLTQKQFAPSCDINCMIQRFLSGDPSAIRRGKFGDFTGLPESLHDACNKVATANSIWENLPETLRATYGSPEALLAALDAQERVTTPTDASTPSEASKPSEASSNKTEPVPSSGSPVPTNT